MDKTLAEDIDADTISKSYRTYAAGYQGETPEGTSRVSTGISAQLVPAQVDDPIEEFPERIDLPDIAEHNVADTFQHRGSQIVTIDNTLDRQGQKASFQTSKVERTVSQVECHTATPDAVKKLFGMISMAQ